MKKRPDIPQLKALTINYMTVNVKVEEIFRSFSEKGRVLELAAGQGGLSFRLREMGYSTFASDLLSSLFKVPDMDFIRMDLNKGFPFKAEMFDYLVCVEGVEHIESHFHFVRESFRILKKNGYLVFSTPNVLGLGSRLKYFLTGFYPLGTRPVNEFEKPEIIDHINLAPFYKFRYVLHTNGFKIKNVKADRYRKSSLFLYWLYPLFKALTALSFSKENHPEQRKANKEILRQLYSREVLLSRSIIVTAQKKSLGT